MKITIPEAEVKQTKKTEKKPKAVVNKKATPKATKNNAKEPEVKEAPISVSTPAEQTTEEKPKKEPKITYASNGIPMGLGRPKGSCNKIPTTIKQGLIETYNAMGGQAWFLELAKTQPKEILKLMAKLIPTTVAGPDTEEKAEAIKINVNLVKQ